MHVESLTMHVLHEKPGVRLIVVYAVCITSIQSSQHAQVFGGYQET